MDLAEWKSLLDLVINNFSIRYEDFSEEEYAPYSARRVVGFIRFDQREVIFDRNIHGPMEHLTWAHEALSIYYYYNAHMLDSIKHDDDIETEARELCKDTSFTGLLDIYIKLIRSKECTTAHNISGPRP